jgi:hypothetical protein
MNDNTNQSLPPVTPIPESTISSPPISTPDSVSNDFSNPLVAGISESPFVRFKRWIGFGVTMMFLVIGGATVYFTQQPPKPTENSLAKGEVSEIKQSLNTIPGGLYSELLVSPDLNTDSLTTAEIDLFQSKIYAVKKSSDTLFISQCRAIPLATVIAPNRLFKIVNEDNVSRTLHLSWGAQRAVVIEPESTLEVLLEFPEGRGIYPYGCDLKSGNSGYFIVE